MRTAARPSSLSVFPGLFILSFSGFRYLAAVINASKGVQIKLDGYL